MTELEDVVPRLRAIESPDERLRAATNLLLELDALILEVGTIRSECRRALEEEKGATRKSPRRAKPTTPQPTDLILKWIRRKNISSFSTRDAFSGLPRGTFPTADSVQMALNALEKSGILERETAPPTSPRGGRPPSPRYTVRSA